jgi:hypothetical protein
MERKLSTARGERTDPFDYSVMGGGHRLSGAE